MSPAKLLKWIDSSMAHESWMSKKDGLKYARKCPVAVYSAGIVMKSNKRGVCLTTCVTDDQYGSALHIPRSAILWEKDFSLKVGKKKPKKGKK